jgi:DNA-binding Lrp family transcriptional regulator
VPRARLPTVGRALVGVPLPFRLVEGNDRVRAAPSPRSTAARLRGRIVSRKLSTGRITNTRVRAIGQQSRPIVLLGRRVMHPVRARRVPWRPARFLPAPWGFPHPPHPSPQPGLPSGYNVSMEVHSLVAPIRRPRFRRASQPPAFRLTEDDVAIVRHLARHRFLRSTHIAALVGRSLDRTNDRLSRLFHAGYIDRPRAQLDYYPTAGSAPIAYALADRGARLLIQRDGVDFANVEWSRKNRAAGRPYIEHQLEIMDFYVALQCATHDRANVHLIHSDDIVAGFPDQTLRARNPFALPVKLSEKGVIREIGIVPDLVFGLHFADSTRHCFMVEIDRGTMPVVRSDCLQTSFERKMRGYLTAHAAELHERHFGWKTFRVLIVTTDRARMQSMTAALQQLHVPRSAGASLFYFATGNQLRIGDPLAHTWQDGNGRAVKLV